MGPEIDSRREVFVFNMVEKSLIKARLALCQSMFLVGVSLHDDADLQVLSRGVTPAGLVSE